MLTVPVSTVHVRYLVDDVEARLVAAHLSEVVERVGHADDVARTAVLRTHEGNQPALNAQVYDEAGALHFARMTKIYRALAFYRALGTNVDGSGLGLAIVKEIADKHGAEVVVENALSGVGAYTAAAIASACAAG